MALKSSSSSSLLQRDSSGLATHNNELKFRLQAMEQQAQLRDGEQPSNPRSSCTHTKKIQSNSVQTIDFVCVVGRGARIGVVAFAR